MPILTPPPAEHAAALQAVLPRLRLPRLCVAVQGATPAELLACAEGVLKDARFLEFRLDLLTKPAAGIGPLKEFLTRHRDVQAIATCRRTPNGGHFSGSLPAELEILQKAAEAGCQIVDLEVESAEHAGKAQLGRFRAALRTASAALLVSFHDFSRTKGLNEAAERIRAFEPDYVKVVSTARTLADNLTVLRMIEDQSLNAQVVGIAMGEEGLVSRVLGPREGAAFTFASAAEGAETAPGQASARTLIDLFHVEQLDQATRIFGVAGNPISHSLSPLMHSTAFKRENVNAIMLPLKVKSLTDLLTLTAELPLSGVAVTMPLKQEVLPHLANMDPLTARIGACNTLRTGADGKLYGFNTDVAGVIRPLEKRMRIKGSRILVLGAGGAARAAVFGLVDQGAEVFVSNRTHETAVALARKAHAKSLKHEVLAKNRFDAIINTTPCGMAGVKQAMPIKENELNAQLVFDMVYNPLDTPLLKLAHLRGLTVISGIEMFVQQGARQFEIWTGKPAPEMEMLRVVELALRKRA
ncbi:MAG: shikimate dehydrogenase [Terracidiphilus sp.]|jgi:3-dehydroquinate dehydratase/shikimate dehydrogenase